MYNINVNAVCLFFWLMVLFFFSVQVSWPLTRYRRRRRRRVKEKRGLSFLEGVAGLVKIFRSDGQSNDRFGPLESPPKPPPFCQEAGSKRTNKRGGGGSRLVSLFLFLQFSLSLSFRFWFRLIPRGSWLSDGPCLIPGFYNNNASMGPAGDT
jgi:hypothetical protein